MRQQIYDIWPQYTCIHLSINITPLCLAVRFDMIDMCLEVTFSLTLASEMMLMFETSYIGYQNTHTKHKNVNCTEGRIWLSFPLMPNESHFQLTC
jgi:hypothetical protein